MAAAAARPITSSVNFDANFHRQYTSIYEVITTDVNDGPITAIEAPGIPVYRSSYSFGNDFDNFAFANGATANIREVEKTHRLWVVVISFSTMPAFRCGDTRFEHPLDEPLRISGSFLQFRRPAEKDKDDKAIVNSVDEPFVPAIEIDDSRKTLVIEKNSPTISLDMWTDFSDAVNSGAIWGLAARTVKLNQWQWTVQYFGTCNAFVSHRWEFHIDKRTWDFKPQDTGFRKLVNAAAADKSERYRTINDDSDYNRHQPTPLNGAGLVIDLRGGDQPFYHSFRIYKERDFTAIGLPNPLPGPFS